MVLQAPEKLEKVTVIRVSFASLSGEVAERPKAAVLKTVEGQPSQGSNPCLSAKLKRGPNGTPFQFEERIGFGLNPSVRQDGIKNPAGMSQARFCVGASMCWDPGGYR